MCASEIGQGSGLVLLKRSSLEQEIAGFLIDRQAQGMAAGTLSYYRKKLKTLAAYLRSVGIETAEGITVPILRGYLL